jgi:hypothetical protein
MDRQDRSNVRFEGLQPSQSYLEVLVPFIVRDACLIDLSFI